MDLHHSSNESRQGEAKWLRRHSRNTARAVTPMILQGRWPAWPPASGSNGTGAGPKEYLRTCTRKSARISDGPREIRRETGAGENFATVTGPASRHRGRPAATRPWACRKYIGRDDHHPLER